VLTKHEMYCIIISASQDKTSFIDMKKLSFYDIIGIVK